MNRLANWLTGTTLGCSTLASFCCCFCLVFTGFEALILPPIMLVTGWITYFDRFRDEYVIDWDIVAIVSAMWGGVFIIIDGVGRMVAYRYLPGRSWSLRRSFAISSLLILVGGAAVTFNNVAFN